MSGKPKISGFTIVRNALELDYPFRESILSLLPLCDEVVIACGDSQDGTSALCEDLARQYPKIQLFHTHWNMENQRGGAQLKEQTNYALSLCQGEWCFYLQADEVLHQGDYEKIRQSLAKADTDPDVDGVVFDYVHFYGSYEYEIRGRNWYRRELRAFKNGRGIQAFRDAQGFRKEESRLQGQLSGARVFHYGHVRNPESVRVKSEHMSKLWGTKASTHPDELNPVRHVGLRRFRATHPEVMQARISEKSPSFDPALYPRRWDRNELKNMLTLVWETFVPLRLGEFRNYDLV